MYMHIYSYIEASQSILSGIFIHIHIHTYMYVYMYVYIYVYIHTYIHTYMHTYMYVIHIYIYQSTCVYIFMYVYLYNFLLRGIAAHSARYRVERLIGSLISIGHFLQKWPIFSGSFVENDLQLRGSYESSPPCSVCMSHIYGFVIWVMAHSCNA